MARISLPEIIPTRSPLYMTPNLRILRRLIRLAASMRVSSGSIVMRGDVITSLAVSLLGWIFFAKTRVTKSLSVIMPRGFPSLVVTMMPPIWLSAMS